MLGPFFLLIPLLLSLSGGLAVGLIPALHARKVSRIWTGVFVTLTSVCMLFAAWKMAGVELLLWQMTPSLPIFLKLDGLSRFFLGLVAVTWVLTAFYAFAYMGHEQEEPRFYAFFLITQGVLSCLTMAGSLVTFYLFYEAMTLVTVPLVLHTRTREAIAAAIKYLVYSVFGASVALLGIFYLSHACETLSFLPGGSLRAEWLSGSANTLRWIAFGMILGFGTKAGMFPLHGWLPTAHPVAPAPASAVLSGVITKMGVLGVIRVVYYCIGVEPLQGTWVQIAWMILALITVFMGSMLALKENVFKKRLAYSSVSQVSYILFALSTMDKTGFQGALLHVLFHSAIKITLFMTAGAVICLTGLTQVSDLRGIGKRMPLLMCLFTVVSLGLIGIPPTGGFVSKWYIATGAMNLPNAFAFIGPAVLLVSAILTAAYLLTITIQGFFPGRDTTEASLSPITVPKRMVVPMLLLSFLVLAGGMFPDRLLIFFQRIAETIL